VLFNLHGSFNNSFLPRSRLLLLVHTSMPSISGLLRFSFFQGTSSPISICS
jgi:hypothetical protein